VKLRVVPAAPAQPEAWDFLLAAIEDRKEALPVVFPVSSVVLRYGAFPPVTAAQSVARNQSAKMRLSRKLLIFSRLSLKADVAKWHTQRT
jgi:hypothetical protein